MASGQNNNAEAKSYERHIEMHVLCGNLSFWDEESIRRHCYALEEQGLIQIHSFTDSLRCSLKKLLPNIHTAHHAEGAQSGQQLPNGASVIDANWCPSPSVVQLLERQYNIPPKKINQLCGEFVIYWAERAEAKQSWDSTFIRYATTQQSRTERNVQRAPIDRHWQPSAYCVEALNQSGISPDSIKKHVAPFINYWLQQDSQAGDWDARFSRYCERQHEYERTTQRNKRQISSDWKPGETVFKVLEQAGIDRAFTESKLPEFILYWLERGDALPDWNTRFVYRIKKLWAMEHNIGGNNWDDFIQRHTDRSWRDGVQ